VNVLVERENGEYIGSIEGFWIVENAKTSEEVVFKLASSLNEFAIDYCNDLELYKTTPNFNFMYPKIERILKSDINSIVNTFEIKVK